MISLWLLPPFISTTKSVILIPVSSFCKVCIKRFWNLCCSFISYFSLCMCDTVHAQRHVRLSTHVRNIARAKAIIYRAITCVKCKCSFLVVVLHLHVLSVWFILCISVYNHVYIITYGKFKCHFNWLLIFCIQKLIGRYLLIVRNLFWILRVVVCCSRMSSESNKRNKVEPSIFLSWGIEAVIGHVNEEKNGKVYVVRVLCKNCAKPKARINGRLRGKAKNMPRLSLKGQRQLQNTR